MNKIIFQNRKLLEYRRKNRSESTDAESLLWSRIRKKDLGYRFQRQYSVGPYILDFYCPKKRLAIELDGGQHTEFEQMEYDNYRTEYLEQFNIKVIRFWNNEVLGDIEIVLDVIHNLLQSL